MLSVPSPARASPAWRTPDGVRGDTSAEFRIDRALTVTSPVVQKNVRARERDTLADSETDLACHRDASADFKIDAACRRDTLADSEFDRACQPNTRIDSEIAPGCQRHSALDLKIDRGVGCDIQADLKIDRGVGVTSKSISKSLAEAARPRGLAQPPMRLIPTLACSCSLGSVKACPRALPSSDQ